MADLFRPWRAPLTSSRLETPVRVLLLVGYLAAIVSVSGVPGDSLRSPVDDRFAHTLEYFIAGLLMLLAALPLVGYEPRPSLFAGALAFGVAFAASDEYHQSFVPGRDSSLKDLAFDVVGLAAAAVVIHIATRRPR